MSHIYLILLLILPLFGFVALRGLLGVNSFVYLLPFSFVFGAATFLALLYGVSFFIGIQKAAFFSLLIMLVFSLCIALNFRKDIFKLKNPLSLQQSSVLVFLCLFISFFTYLITDKWIMWDFKFHLSVANYFISTDKFPQSVSNWPSLFIPYHYGFNLLSAAITKLAGISVINSFRLIIIISSIIIPLSCFAIASFFVNDLWLSNDKNQVIKFKYMSSLFGGLFFYFASNLLWLDALVRYLLKIPPVSQSWTFIQTMLGIGIHGSIISDIGSGGILFASLTIGIQLFLLLLFLYLRFLYSSSLSISYILSIFIVSLSLFHIAEWILYVFLLATVISTIVSFIYKDHMDFKNPLIKNSVCILIYTLIIFLNGLAYRILSQEYSYMPSFLELTLNPKPFSLSAFGRFGNLNEHRDVNLFSWDFISEFGFQFIFSGFVIYWLIKKRVKGLNFILSFLFISFVAPFCLYIKSSPPDSVRLFHPGYELLSMLFILWLFEWKDNLKTKPGQYLVRVFVFVFLLPSIVTLVLTGLFSPGVYLNYPYIAFIDYSAKELIKDKNILKFNKNINDALVLMKNGAVIDETDLKISSYLKTHSKAYEYGVSSNPFPFDYIGRPCYSALRGSSLARRITYVTLLRTLDPYLLKELKIKWLYLDPKTSEFIDLKLVDDLVKSGFLKEALVVNSPVYGQSKLYKFIDIKKHIEQVPRRVYWTFFVYGGQNLIPLSDSSGSQVAYLFSSEKAATDFLKEQIKNNPEFKGQRPFVDAIDENIVNEQAKLNGIIVKHIS